MSQPIRAPFIALALLAAATLPLHGGDGAWSLQVGAAQPSGGLKAWMGTTTGIAVDLVDSFALGQRDTVRMRFGFQTFKANGSTPETIQLPNGAGTVTAATAATAEAYTFSYGADYVYAPTSRFYVLAGVGVAYVTATRKGTFDLGASGVARTNYSANNFVPAFCAGLGFQATKAVALELRWQSTTLKEQQRPIDLNTAGIASPGQVQFAKQTVTSLSLGVSIAF
ncbi:MAG TPA: hypothetical protein VK188_10680 [Holophaga sp.]|nr:hypothetical protein [Holophaga sp.]